jgi:hypothetical protein
MKVLCVAALSLVAASLVASAAHADPKAACVEASSKAQRMRGAHQLLEARDQLRVCAAAACPAVVQSDCATWLEEVERAIPTVVLSAKDGAGNDVFDVTVSVDGAPLAGKLDGSALAMNPGPHTFHFVRADGTTTDRQVLVQEGQKAIAVEARLGAIVAPAPKTTPAVGTAGGAASATGGAASGTGAGASGAAGAGTAAGAPASHGGGSAWHTVGWIAGALGVVGLGVGSVFGVIAVSKKSDAQCDATNACNNWSAVGDSRNAATVANVGLIAGGALVATGGALLLFTHDAGGTSEGRTASVSAAPMVGPTGGGVTLTGRW